MNFTKSAASDTVVCLDEDFRLYSSASLFYPTRPSSGTMVLYSRKKVRYRRDGFCWKKRRDGKTTREDHMKLKVQGVECIYGCYVHSAILQTFHRRCYWLLQVIRATRMVAFLDTISQGRQIFTMRGKNLVITSMVEL